MQDGHTVTWAWATHLLMPVCTCRGVDTSLCECFSVHVCKLVFVCSCAHLHCELFTYKRVFVPVCAWVCVCTQECACRCACTHGCVHAYMCIWACAYPCMCAQSVPREFTLLCCLLLGGAYVCIYTCMCTCVVCRLCVQWHGRLQSGQAGGWAAVEQNP